MTNILVVEDNLNYLKKITNILSDLSIKVNLCKIAIDESEAIDIIKNTQNNIDAILIDLKMVNINEIQIFDYIESNKLIQFKNSIIVVSGENGTEVKLKNNAYLFSYISENSDISKIIMEIEKLAKIKEDEKSLIEYKICNELKHLQYNFSYVGTKYLMEAILLLYYNKLWEDIKLEKEIYPIISKKYKKSVNSIKCNIIYATNEMFFDCNQETLLSYLEEYSLLKPGPKKIIFSVLEKIKKPSV